MENEPNQNERAEKSFPLRDGSMEVGQTLSNTFLRIPLWRDVAPPPGMSLAVPGARIIDACGMWLGEAFGPGAFMHKIQRANFSEFLTTEEPMTAVCTLEKVISGRQGISALFSLKCVSVKPGPDGQLRDIAQMEFTMFRPNRAE